MGTLRIGRSVWAALALACFVGGGLIQETRRTRSDLWEIVPGRAFIISYLWLRADRLKDEGRYYDVKQQAELICRLQRRFPSVWSFAAWNMIYNISVATHTPQERWRWVHNGIQLLRDEGIRLNPTSLLLYKDLGWTFFFKIGDHFDDMHWTYKRQWAVRMQDLLGAPPDGSPEELAAAFRPVAEAAIDRNPDRLGTTRVQADKLRELLADPEVAAYAAALGEWGGKVDESFLDVYNHFSLDPAVTVVRTEAPELSDARDAALSELINAPAHAGARAKALAFLRAQILWNVYRMDPAVMGRLMKRYGPLDWRLPHSHALYWLVHGREVCKDASPDQYDKLNTDRVILNCLHEMTMRGRLTMTDGRRRGTTEDVLSSEQRKGKSDKDLPRVLLHRNFDLRFVEATQQEYDRQIIEMAGSPERAAALDKNNPLRNGHINYLVNAIKALYAAHRRAEAQKWLNWVRLRYAPVGPEWLLGDVEDFVLWGLRRDRDAPRGFAEGQVAISLTVAMVALARGDRETFDESYAYAHKVHRVYNQGRDERTRLDTMAEFTWTIAMRLLVAPKPMGFHLSLTERSQLYKSLDEASRKAIYPRISRPLKSFCKAEGIDFEKAFPAPAEPKGRRPGQPEPAPATP
jgi:hypothetical protein